MTLYWSVVCSRNAQVEHDLFASSSENTLGSLAPTSSQKGKLACSVLLVAASASIPAMISRSICFAIIRFGACDPLKHASLVSKLGPLPNVSHGAAVPAESASQFVSPLLRALAILSRRMLYDDSLSERYLKFDQHATRLLLSRLSEVTICLIWLLIKTL